MVVILTFSLVRHHRNSWTHPLLFLEIWQFHCMVLTNIVLLVWDKSWVKKEQMKRVRMAVSWQALGGVYDVVKVENKTVGIVFLQNQRLIFRLFCLLNDQAFIGSGVYTVKPANVKCKHTKSMMLYWWGLVVHKRRSGRCKGEIVIHTI